MFIVILFYFNYLQLYCTCIIWC